MQIAAEILTAIVLGLTRIHGDKSQIFQAIAHLYVGGMFVAAYYSTGERKTARYGIAVGLSILELTCFLVFKYLGR